jgi:hypothetical protein
MDVAARVAAAVYTIGNGWSVQLLAIVSTVVVTVPPLLADLVLDVLRPHLELRLDAVLGDRHRLADHLRALAPDLVVLGLRSNETDALAATLLSILPAAAFLVVAANGQHAWLHGMRPHRTALNELTVSALVAALTTRFKATPSEG